MKRASNKSLTIEQQRKVNMKNLDHSNMGVVAIVPEVAVSTVSTIIVFLSTYTFCVNIAAFVTVQEFKWSFIS